MNEGIRIVARTRRGTQLNLIPRNLFLFVGSIINRSQITISGSAGRFSIAMNLCPVTSGSTFLLSGFEGNFLQEFNHDR
jgi:hypothetical protein